MLSRKNRKLRFLEISGGVWRRVSVIIWGSFLLSQILLVQGYAKTHSQAQTETLIKESPSLWKEKDFSFHKPFWRSKPEVLEKMDKNDLIVVSTNISKKGGLEEGYEMKVMAGGIAKAPYFQTSRLVSNFEKLKEADSHFKEVRWDFNKKELYLWISALGYSAKMTLLIHEVEDGNPTENGNSERVSSQSRVHNGGREGDKHRKWIYWECIQGHFLGMRGVFEILEIERQKTEISMTALYNSKSLPLPKVLMGLGLEIVGRQVASNMRSYIQSQYRNN